MMLQRLVVTVKRTNMRLLQKRTSYARPSMIVLIVTRTATVGRCWARGLWCGLDAGAGTGDGEAESKYCPDRPDDHCAVVIAFPLRKLCIWYEAGMPTLGVVSLRSECPTVPQALCSPDVVNVLGQQFYQLKDFVAEHGFFCRIGFGL